MPRSDLINLIKWIGYLTIKLHLHIWIGVLISYFILWLLIFIVFFPNFNRKTATIYHYTGILILKIFSKFGLLITIISKKIIFYTPIFINDILMVLKSEWPAFYKILYNFYKNFIIFFKTNIHKYIIK